MMSNMGDDHDGGGGTKVIKCSGLEKNKEKKPKKTQGKGIIG